MVRPETVVKFEDVDCLAARLRGPVIEWRGARTNRGQP
jgi:hypothetical protein